MARKAMVEKNNDNRKLSEKYFKHRKELRNKSVNMSLSEEERMEARLKLNKLPRDTSAIRVTNRCALSGRPRATLRKFGISRIAFRQLALDGKLPGVTKASW